MIYAVLDTNVIVSAMLKVQSNPGHVLIHSLQGEIVPVVNEDILKEYNEVLRRSKFKFREDVIERIILGISSRALFLNGIEADEVIPDDKDVVFYEVTMDARQEREAFLVTGNGKHFPQRSFIVTPKEMLEIMKSI